MTDTPTVREVLARAVAAIWLEDNAFDFHPAAAIIIEALAKAGIPESQLDSLLAGEAVVVRTGPKPTEDELALYRKLWAMDAGERSESDTAELMELAKKISEHVTPEDYMSPLLAILTALSRLMENDPQALQASQESGDG